MLSSVTVLNHPAPPPAAPYYPSCVIWGFGMLFQLSIHDAPRSEAAAHIQVGGQNLLTFGSYPPLSLNENEKQEYAWPLLCSV